MAKFRHVCRNELHEFPEWWKEAAQDIKAWKDSRDDPEQDPSLASKICPHAALELFESVEAAGWPCTREQTQITLDDETFNAFYTWAYPRPKFWLGNHSGQRPIVFEPDD
jgi:hypothetical protein